MRRRSLGRGIKTENARNRGGSMHSHQAEGSVAGARGLDDRAVRRARRDGYAAVNSHRNSITSDPGQGSLAAREGLQERAAPARRERSPRRRSCRPGRPRRPRRPVRRREGVRPRARRRRRRRSARPRHHRRSTASVLHRHRRAARQVIRRRPVTLANRPRGDRGVAC